MSAASAAAAAQAAKARGNAAFAAGSFASAVKAFTEAIGLDATDHLLFSNRSAAFSSARQYGEARADAERVVAMAPNFAKGHGRLGAALVGLKMHHEAATAYERGLALDPESLTLKEGLVAAQAKARADEAEV